MDNTIQKTILDRITDRTDLEIVTVDKLITTITEDSHPIIVYLDHSSTTVITDLKDMMRDKYRTMNIR